MCINPSNATTVDLPVPDELNYFIVCDQGRVAHRFVCGKKLRAAAAITDQQLPVNEIVT